MKTLATLLLLNFCLAETGLAQEVRGRTKSGSFGIPEPKAILSATAEFTEPSGNNALDAGEKGLLKVTIANVGTAVAKGVVAKLTSATPVVFLSFSPTLSAGDLTPGSTKVVTFELTARDNLPTQTVPFTIQVSDESGIEAEPKSIFIATKERVIAKDESPPVIEMIEPKEITSSGLKVVGDPFAVTQSSIRVRGLAKDPSGVAIVWINEREAEIAQTKDGIEFSGVALLVLGENTIEIKAVDKFGNEGSVRFTVRRERPATVDEPRIPRELFKGQRWAVVIGISQYRDTSIPQLRYADRDAQGFYEMVTRPLEEGGMGIPKSNVRFLVNKQATSTNVREALNEFLKAAFAEDIVIVYFAGHGAPDPDRPRVLYLLTHDSNLGSLGATAIKMQEVQDALRDYVIAKTVLVFADACHSRGVTGAVATRSLASTELVNDYLAELARSRPSTLTFSASDVNQLSQEDIRWGGGHGVFTYYLLEGMRGKADFDNDNLVRLGELLQYVTDNVRRETKSTQSPISSGSYDINLPMTIVIDKK